MSFIDGDASLCSHGRKEQEAAKGGTVIGECEEPSSRIKGIDRRKVDWS